MHENPKVATTGCVLKKEENTKKINTLTPRYTFSVKYCVYASLTKKEVKMAGYWCRTVLCFYGSRRSQDQ